MARSAEGVFRRALARILVRAFAFAFAPLLMRVLGRSIGRWFACWANDLALLCVLGERPSELRSFLACEAGNARDLT